MKTIAAILIFFLSLAPPDSELEWLTNFEEARLEAEASDKLILMRFTGSDWCANCIRLDTTLIETPQFSAFAKEKFILLYVDFPAKEENKLPPKQAAHNERLRDQYNPSKSFPALIVLNAEGQALGQMNVRPNSVEGYLDILSDVGGFE